MRTRLLGSILPLVCLAAVAQTANQIQGVENGLRPPYTVEGAPATTWKIADRMQFYEVPAVSIAVVRDGKIAWAKAYGVIETGSKAANPETLFQAASISKPVAATAAMALVRKGVLSLDEDVNQKLVSWKVPDNEFTKTEKVTLRRLLSHSAGMTVHGFPGYATDAPAPSLVQILNGEKPANTGPIRVDVAPGSMWRYSGGGFTVMQQLLIDVEKKPFPEIVQSAVLAPADMHRSGYRQPLPESFWSNAARAYTSDGKEVAGRWHVYPELAAAGLWTTPTDLMRFAIELRKEARGESSRILDQKSAMAMLTRQKDDYGLGLSLSGEGTRQRFGHGGANEGYRCQFEMYLDSGDGAAVMTNSDAGGSLSAEIFRSLAAVYGWPDFQPRTLKVTKLDPSLLPRYAANYEVDGMKVHVSVEDDKLWVKPGEGPKAELLPESETKFVVGDGNLPELDFFKSDKGEITGFKAFGHDAKRVQ